MNKYKLMIRYDIVLKQKMNIFRYYCTMENKAAAFGAAYPQDVEVICS
jgi:hypothetical protein